MNKNYRNLRTAVLWIADLIAALISYVISLAIRYGHAIYVPNSQILLILILVLSSTVISLVFHLNNNFMGRGNLCELRAVFLHNMMLEIGLIVAFYVMHSSGSVSRLVAGYFFLINMLLMFLGHILLKKIAELIFGREIFRKKIILVTDEKHRDQVEENFNPGYSFLPIGYLIVDDKAMRGKIYNQPVSADAGTVPNKIVTTAFDDIFLFAPSLHRERQREIIDEFATMGVQVHVGIGLPIQIGQNVTLSDFGENFYCANYSANVFDPSQMFVKRVVDIIGAIVGLILTGIIWIFLAPAIKMDSPGPVFFSQTRVGRNGKRFKIYKFRSMYQDAEARKAELMKQNQMQGLMFKMDDDPRVTRVGKFIRKTSLDEFPQFWNVLKGDMSLVGTRPPTEKEFLQYDAYYRARLTLRPGLTGLWQVSGRSDITDFDEVVKLDMQYINNWSLSNDIKIIFKTIGVLLNRKGAK